MTAPIKTVEPSEKETEVVLRRLRQGLNPPHGYVVDFSLQNPVRKIDPAALKEIEKIHVAERKEAEEIEAGDWENMDIEDFEGIESIAQAQRPSAPVSNAATQAPASTEPTKEPTTK